MKVRIKINEQIDAPELRILGADGANLGTMSPSEGVKLAQAAGLDLIEISPKAKPPVARVMDYGKYQYEQKKKEKEIKAKAHVTETKVTQVKIGTGTRDLELKAKKVSGWLAGGDRVKIDLFLWGRYKYMEFNFLKERLERFLTLITEDFKVADEIKKSPKGLSVTVERTGKGPKKELPEVKKEGNEPVAEKIETKNENK